MTREEAAEILVKTAGEEYYGVHYQERLARMLDDTPYQLAGCFKLAAMRAHPDHGGSVEAFKRLTEARDVLAAT